MPDDCRDDPILGPALTYWILKRGTRAIPLKRDIDPPKSYQRSSRTCKSLTSSMAVSGSGIGWSERLWPKPTARSYADELVSGERLRFILHGQGTDLFAQPLYTGPYLGTRALRARGVTVLAATIARQGAPA